MSESINNLILKIDIIKKYSEMELKELESQLKVVETAEKLAEESGADELQKTTIMNTKGLMIEGISRIKSNRQLLEIAVGLSESTLQSVEILSRAIKKLLINDETKSNELKELNEQMDENRKMLGSIKEFLEAKRREDEDREKWR